jgi:hypothetical protein
MIETLPEPQVVRCYFDESFVPSLPAIRLRWKSEPAGPRERSWSLPEGVCLTGPLPEHFGIEIHRQEEDGYTVRLLWDRVGLTWPLLSRAQLFDCALPPLLSALGTDLWYLLDQPVQGAARMPRTVA